MKEGRPMTKENPEKPTAPRTQSRGEAMSGLDRIRKAARGDKTLRLNNLMHHVTVDLLRESYHALKHDAAAGVDKMTWDQYGEGLEARLADLHERAQNGRYRPKPSKRTYIPKADGRQRTAAAHRDRRAGGQGSPAGGQPGPGRDLGGGLRQLQLRVPPGAQPAQRVGRALGGDHAAQGQLGARRGHPELF
jgi:hypothetical protein